MLAESLYQQGRQLMQEGHLATACSKLAESQRLDPATGTLLNLAVCREGEGKTATAWSLLIEARDRARQDGRPDRVRFAEEHLAAITARLSHLTVEVPPSVRVPGLAVELDGVPLGAAAWGTPIPVDPTQHRLRASAPGHTAVEVVIAVGPEGDRQVVKVGPLPSLAREPSAGATQAAEPPRVSGGSAAAPTSPRRTLGYVVGGLGVVAAGVGGYFGVQAMTRWDARNQHCDTRDFCDAQGVRLGSSAQDAALAADIGVGLGLLGVGAGAYLLLTAPSTPDAESPAALRVSVRGGASGALGGATLRGEW